MLGEYYETRERNLEYAVGYYGETLRHDDSHEKSILALARIHLHKNELDVCEKQLMTLLRVDPSNEEASMLMAELNMMLAAQGGRSDGGAQEYKDATFYYQALLEKKPCNYTALSKLIFLLRRAGRLRDAPKYIQAAEKACTRSPEREAGLRFCRGTYYRWISKQQDALVELNFARRDPDFRVEALTHMIEIYLNPDPNAGLDSLDVATEPLNDNLREVDNLLKELSQVNKQSWNPRLKVYQCQSLMFTKQKTNVEHALSQLMDIYNDKKDYIPALLAMSQGLIIQKQQTKARNQLKRIADLAKKGYNPEFMDDFERAWLLLAEIYIQSSKYDLASSLCHLAKDHNRSCGKAWEQLGLIYEKEQAYKDAASHYEKAWEFCNEASPAVGYRLAFNYLKAKRYVPAINVCQSVLKISENYPKIKKDGVALLVAAVLLLLLLFTRAIFIDVGSRDGLLLASGAASQPGKEPLAAVAVARQARSLSSCASLPASVLRDVQHVALVHRGVWRCLHISTVTKYSDFHVWLEAGDGSGVRVQGSKVFLRQGWLGDEEAVESVEDFGLNSSTAENSDPRVLSSGAVIEQPYAFGMPQQEGHWPVRSVGVMHAAFLTEDGEVYCLGRNSCGECAVDPAVQNVAASCRKVSFPKHSHPIRRVECGRSHTVAVGADGQCFAWGDDSKIQLGLGDTRSNVGEERPFSGSRGFLNTQKTGQPMATQSFLRGGPEFTGSRVFSTSQKKYGDFESHQQIKPATMMDIPLEPERQVHGTPYPPPSDVRCGGDFTLLLVRDSPDWYPPEEESQRLFCCGENGKGQCGRSLQQQQQVFAACKLPRNSKMLGFSCGSDHCVAVIKRIDSRKQELWCWGHNAEGQAGGSNSGAVCPAARLRLPRGARVEAAWCGFSSSGAICSDSSSRFRVKDDESDSEG
ncbi:unnamed protein product [Effrenium voratum]|uniref:Uncharacterized protein n=1 Tax=Effrenium voratum TaxID=2562239 RepID=A0AA36IV84_9DINO|nr:unnamed protein product [Effrenium voratum]